MPALGVVADILFVRHEQKDSSGKPDPQGNAQIKKNSNPLPDFTLRLRQTFLQI